MGNAVQRGPSAAASWDDQNQCQFSIVLLDIWPQSLISVSGFPFRFNVTQLRPPAAPLFGPIVSQWLHRVTVSAPRKNWIATCQAFPLSQASITALRVILAVLGSQSWNFERCQVVRDINWVGLGDETTNPWPSKNSRTLTINHQDCEDWGYPIGKKR